MRKQVVLQGVVTFLLQSIFKEFIILIILLLNQPVCLLMLAHKIRLLSSQHYYSTLVNFFVNVNLYWYTILLFLIISALQQYNCKL